MCANLDDAEELRKGRVALAQVKRVRKVLAFSDCPNLKLITQALLPHQGDGDATN